MFELFVSSKIKISVLGGLAVLSSAGIAQAPNRSVDLGSCFANGGVTAWQAQVTPENNTFRINFNALPTNYPHAIFRFPSPQNWSTSEAMSVDIENLGADAARISVRLDDRVDADGTNGSTAGWITIPGNTRMSVSFPINIRSANYGMHLLPITLGNTWLQSSSRTINFANVARVLFFTSLPQAASSFRVSNMRLMSIAGTLNRITDAWGQNALVTFPGKVTSDADFATDDTLELAELAANPKPAHYSRYGGHLQGTRYTGTGRFRTQLIGNKWTFIDPDGYTFISMGVNGVGNEGRTNLDGREFMFRWLPSETGPWAWCYSNVSGVLNYPTTSSKVFNFHLANVARRYKSDWFRKSAERHNDRLLSWGFNTIGAFSEGAVYFAKRVPYTVAASVSGSIQRLSIDPSRASSPDPFDPGFTQAVNLAINGFSQALADPYCIGWFFDNELTVAGGLEEDGRYGAALATLRAPITSFAKAELIRDLQAKYPSIGSLNTAWQTTFATWSELESPVTFTTDGTAARKADFRDWCLKFFREYYRGVERGLHTRDPQALYLGSRLYRTTYEANVAAAEFADVLSYNVYANSPNTALPWSEFQQFNKPLFIGEFHVGSTDRNNWNAGYVQAPNMASRVAMARDYMRDAVNNPGIIGFHWFQWNDQPITGRWFDGENMGCGLLSITDRPWPEMRDLFRQFLPTVYSLRDQLP